VRALLCPLFAWSALAKSADVLAGTTGYGTALASVRLVGLFSGTTVVADTTVEGAALASVRLVVVCQASLCVGGNDR
jgi:hypothetical protein